MAESKLRELSTDFAIKIIRLCETIGVTIRRILIASIYTAKGVGK